MFSELGAWEHPVVVLGGMTAKVVRLLVEFIYRGRVQMREDLIETFLEAGARLQVRGVAGAAHTSEVVLQDNTHMDTADSDIEEVEHSQVLNSTRREARGRQATKYFYIYLKIFLIHLVVFKNIL